MARQRFGSGLTDFQTVLDTQRVQLSTQDALASAFATVSSDQVRLYKALGGGWTSAEMTDSPPRATSLSTVNP
jgi:outer membrane protein TolC